MKRIYVFLLVLLIPLAFQFGSGWKVTSPYDTITTDEVTITTAGTSDTTRWFEGSRYMTVIPLPWASANNDSFALAAAADSCKVDVYIEGWSSKFAINKTPTGVCMARIKLWDPFTLQTYATSNEADSSYKVVDTASGAVLGKGYALYATASVQDDSLRIVPNSINAPLWPWCRIIITDADTKTANGYVCKFKVIGYTP